MDYQDKYLKYKSKYLKLKELEDSQNNRISLTNLSKLSSNIVRNSFNMMGGSSKNTLYLMKAEWCPHCVAFKPIWNKLQDELKDLINFKTLDSEKDKEEIKTYNIDGFPTIIFRVGDKSYEYVGPRDEQGIKDFIKQYNK
jgi:thiol-disulfide isomerase/thioredoxin